MDAQHLRDEFLGELKVLASTRSATARSHRARASLDGVQPVAGCRLRDLNQAGFGIQIEYGPE